MLTELLELSVKSPEVGREVGNRVCPPSETGVVVMEVIVRELWKLGALRGEWPVDEIERERLMRLRDGRRVVAYAYEIK